MSRSQTNSDYGCCPCVSVKPTQTTFSQEKTAICCHVWLPLPQRPSLSANTQTPMLRICLASHPRSSICSSQIWSREAFGVRLFFLFFDYQLIRQFDFMRHTSNNSCRYPQVSRLGPILVHKHQSSFERRYQPPFTWKTLFQIR